MRLGWYVGILFGVTFLVMSAILIYLLPAEHPGIAKMMIWAMLAIVLGAFGISILYFVWEEYRSKKKGKA